MDLWETPSGVPAMIAGVITFIALYTIVTCIPGFFDKPDGMMSKALRLGLRVRLIVSLASLIVALLAIRTGHELGMPYLYWCPDFWAGYLTYFILDEIDDVIRFGPFNEFLEVYIWTVLEGLILSAFLFLVSFMSLLIMNIRARRRGDYLPKPDEMPEVLAGEE